MGGLKGRFAHVCKAVAAAAILLAALGLPARAQFIGTVGQASTVSNFTVAPTGHAETIIPVCTVSVTTNCIKMIGQVSHLVTLNTFDAGTPCSILLDGSTDSTHWSTIAAIALGIFPGVSSNTITANGYYPVVRLRINPNGANSCLGMTGTYSGFQTPLPLSPNVVNNPASVSTVINLLFPTPFPYLLAGFQCFNPAGSTAYLQLFDAATTPTLGTAFEYQIGIPAGGLFVYPPGAAILGTQIFFTGASTAAGGSTPVSTALVCDFQINYQGPFAPLNPPSP